MQALAVAITTGGDVESLGRILMVVMWPSFLTAACMVGVTFSLVDPKDLIIHGLHVPEDPLAVYAIAFFVFWVLSALSSYMTHVLDKRFT